MRFNEKSISWLLGICENLIFEYPVFDISPESFDKKNDSFGSKRGIKYGANKNLSTLLHNQLAPHQLHLALQSKKNTQLQNHIILIELSRYSNNYLGTASNPNTISYHIIYAKQNRKWVWSFFTSDRQTLSKIQISPFFSRHTETFSSYIGHLCIHRTTSSHIIQVFCL